MPSLESSKLHFISILMRFLWVRRDKVESHECNGPRKITDTGLNPTNHEEFSKLIKFKKIMKIFFATRLKFLNVLKRQRQFSFTRNYSYTNNYPLPPPLSCVCFMKLHWWEDICGGVGQGRESFSRMLLARSWPFSSGMHGCFAYCKD